MPITQILKEARGAGETTVVTFDGVYSLRWAGTQTHWVFVPR